MNSCRNAFNFLQIEMMKENYHKLLHLFPEMWHNPMMTIGDKGNMFFLMLDINNKSDSSMEINLSHSIKGKSSFLIDSRVEVELDKFNKTARATAFENDDFSHYIHSYKGRRRELTLIEELSDFLDFWLSVDRC